MKIKHLTTTVIISLLSFGLMTSIASCSSTQEQQGSGENDTTVAQDTNIAPSIYIESTSGLAIRGADPVAYFTQAKAVKGTSEFEYEWNGATWRFSSQEHLNLFTENPEKYAPQYGGYCAKAVSEGNLASIDPESWKIVDDKLYLNYSPEVQKQWSEDIPGSIALGDQNWPDVLEGTKVHENQIEF